MVPTCVLQQNAKVMLFDTATLVVSTSVVEPQIRFKVQLPAETRSLTVYRIRHFAMLRVGFDDMRIRMDEATSVFAAGFDSVSQTGV